MSRIQQDEASLERRGNTALLPAASVAPPTTASNAWIAQSTRAAPTPTEQTYCELQVAYSTFNRELFAGALPEAVITLQRSGRSYGFFCAQRFANRAGTRSDEIALNPTFFPSRSDVGVLSTLAHEMAHLWKFHFGKVGRPGYHCREWARRMMEIGLQPSNTGKPGGRQTGYQMTHYIISGSPFEILTNEMIAGGFKLSWLEAAPPLAGHAPVSAPPSSADCDGSHRWKYTCPRCGFNAWAKPNGLVVCGTCYIPMPRNLRTLRPRPLTL